MILFFLSSLFLLLFWFLEIQTKIISAYIFTADFVFDRNSCISGESGFLLSVETFDSVKGSFQSFNFVALCVIHAICIGSISSSSLMMAVFCVCFVFLLVTHPGP